MEQKATIIVLSPRFPYPLEKGDKLRLYHQLLVLSEKFDIHLISLSEEKIEQTDLDKLKDICVGVHIIRQKKWLNLRAAVRSFWNRVSIQESYYYSRSIQRKIDQIVEEVKPKVLFVQLIRMAKYVENWKIPKLIDYMDAMSLNMEREAEKHAFPYSFIYKRESKLLSKAERCMSSKFDAKFIISEQDKTYLNSIGVKDLQIQSNGVNLDFFNSKNLGSSNENYDLVFVGNMGYLPNVQAVEYLVNEVLNPYFPNLRLLIAGARPHERVKNLQSKNVQVSGWIEDIREAYLNGKIVVAPIFTGAGQQNKILEAMSLGRACITTSQVNAAINANTKTEILIADSAEQFRDQIDLLLNSSEIRQKIGINARIFVEQKFEWKKQVEILENALLKLAKYDK